MKLSAEQVRNYLSEFSTNKVYHFTNPNYNAALEASLDLIDDYRILLSDVMHYGMVRCKNCNHYNMSDEKICHTCYAPLPIDKTTDHQLSGTMRSDTNQNQS